MLPIGQLRIVEVRQIAEDDITDEDARRAGYASREVLQQELLVLLLLLLEQQLAQLKLRRKSA